jgi:NHLM bacteriocin system ABC transporter peptidase/ATP-binding protein
MKKTRVKTPTVLQMEATECGAASLSMVLSYYGKYMPLEELRSLLNVGRDGSSAKNIMLAGYKLGMEGNGYAYSPEELKKVVPPAILHWGFDHFLVYEGFDEKKNIAFLNDPAAGHKSVAWSEFEEMFTGICLILRPAADFVKSGSRPRPWRALIDDVLEKRSALGFVLLIAASMAAVNLFSPVVSQIFFDDVITYSHRDWLTGVLLAFAAIFILKSVLLFFSSWCLLRWQGSMTINKSAAFFEHLLRLPLEFYQQRYVGEIVSRLQLNETIASFVTGKLATVVIDFGMAVLYLSLLFIYNAELTLIGIFFTMLNLGLLYYTYGWMKEQQMKLQQEGGKLYGLAASGISAMESLKANGSEGDFFTKWANSNVRYMQICQHSEYIEEYISFVPAVLSAINAAAIMAIGGFEIMDGFMTVGVFVAFQSLMSSFQEPVASITGMTLEIQQSESQMMRVNDVLRYKPEEKVTVREQGSNIPVRLSGRLEMKKVSFNYTNIGKPLIKKFNLKIEPGRRVAIVGRSGSGKSTVARLAAGFYKPWSGDILFDDIPIDEVPTEVMANSVSLVEQEIYLFEGTVAENIALFDSTVSRQAIIQAAKDAQIHDDISQLNGGYDAMVAEGGQNFSGGQRQRLEIARALATNPTLLIFDEATSALDPVTEKAIMTNLRRRGCACLMIAHRLSTIRDCDEIIVLKNGRVVQRGTHAELAAKEGAYRDLISE